MEEIQKAIVSSDKQSSLFFFFFFFYKACCCFTGLIVNSRAIPPSKNSRLNELIFCLFLLPLSQRTVTPLNSKEQLSVFSWVKGHVVSCKFCPFNGMEFMQSLPLLIWLHSVVLTSEAPLRTVEVNHHERETEMPAESVVLDNVFRFSLNE